MSARLRLAPAWYPQSVKPCLLALLLGGGLLASSCGDSPSCERLDCDDDNPCTADECNPGRAACEHQALPDAASCETNGAPGLCSAGACATLSCQNVDCDDENPCTLDACFPETEQCTNLPLAPLSVCEIDGSFGTCFQRLCDLSLPPSGEVALRVELVGVEANLVSYELFCASDTTLSGTLSSSAGVWQAFLTLPAGDCSARFSAADEMGETLCTGVLSFQVVPATQTSEGVTLICGV